MWVLPVGPSQRETEKLLFPIEDFQVFGQNGILQTRRKRRSEEIIWSHKFRTEQPEVGDAVGIFNNLWLSAFQIEAVGFVAAKRGNVYDVWITQADPLKWVFQLFTYDLIERSEKIPLGLKTEVDAKYVVPVHPSMLDKYSMSKLTEAQREEFEAHKQQPKRKRQKLL